jgi:uncharacterized protein YbjT (DUF2867 family)
MKIVILGGTGLIGTKLGAILRDRGHDVLAASPSSGVDAVTGTGLTEAFAGAEAVVDVTNAPSWADDAVMQFFQSSAKHVLAAEKAAGVRHHVALSVVGAERMPSSGYMRAKVAQEAALAAGDVPYTIVRATQFFEFVKAIVDGATKDGAPTLSSNLIQPMAADDVAAALADVVVAAPARRVIEIGGPEAMGLDALARRYLDAKKDPRRVTTDATVGYFGAELQEKTLVPGDGARLGATTFAAWLAKHVRS